MSQPKGIPEMPRAFDLAVFANSFNWKTRIARKAHRCDCANARGHGTGRCQNVIAIGERYVEGEMDPYRAGGFGNERYCRECCELMSARTGAA